MKGKVFTAQEVQSILNGSKVMFREVIEVQPTNSHQQIITTISSTKKSDEGKFRWAELDNKKLNILNATDYFKRPYQIGQKIFVKEVFCKSIFGRAIYKDEADQIRGFAGEEVVVKWRPAQHMKQEHSRLTLEITNIKVERLGEISEDDAIKEGIPLSNEFKDRYYTPEGNYATAKIAFMRWWNATHKKPEEKFEVNPFVWVVDFKINN